MGFRLLELRLQGFVFLCLDCKGSDNEGFDSEGADSGGLYSEDLDSEA